MTLTTTQANTGPCLSGELTHAQHTTLTTGQKVVLNQLWVPGEWPAPDASNAVSDL